MGGGEDAEEGVEVGLGDGVEFVVVTAGTGDGEALEGFGDGVDLVVGEGDHFVQGIDGREAVEDHAELADADGAFIEAVVDAWFGEEVTGDGFLNELRVGDVGVEGADEVVAVAVGVGDGGVAFGAVGFGVTDPVHEVAGPFFAEVGGVQQGVDLV